MAKVRVHLRRDGLWERSVERDDGTWGEAHLVKNPDGSLLVSTPEEVRFHYEHPVPSRTYVARLVVSDAWYNLMEFALAALRRGRGLFRPEKPTGKPP